VTALPAKQNFDLGNYDMIATESFLKFIDPSKTGTL
jgi:hypothetical protein